MWLSSQGDNVSRPIEAAESRDIIIMVPSSVVGVNGGGREREESTAGSRAGREATASEIWQLLGSPS